MKSILTMIPGNKKEQDFKTCPYFNWLDCAMKKSSKNVIMEVAYRQTPDIGLLSALNEQFIKNFLNQDVEAHNKIIHADFICIESNGAIVNRDQYLLNWSTDFGNSGYTSFKYAEEHIRVFGNMGLVRAKTIYTQKANEQIIEGSTIYTDTYFKEREKWKCVQVQITPVK